MDRQRGGVLLVVVAAGLVLLWLLRPLIATVVCNNLGSLYLNRALLSPDLEPAERTALAVRAGQTFHTALAWEPYNGWAAYNLAAVYELWQDAPSAARTLSRAAALNPGDAGTRFRLGQALAAQGQEEAAIAEWRAAHAAGYFVQQALELLREGDEERALQQAGRALAIDPQLPEAYTCLGRALSALGRADEAVAAFESAAALYPDSSPERYLLRGEVLVAQGEWAAALVAFARAADLAPTDPEPHQRMGWVLLDGLDDPAQAQARFQWALHLEPGYVPALLALGQLDVDQGDCDEAAVWLVPLTGRQVQDSLAAQVQVMLGRCLLEQDRQQEALVYLEQAVASSPRSVWAQSTLAAAYSQAGRYHEAIAAYLQVLELDPGNVSAQQALEELGWTEHAD